jgi:hypothetical protein
LLLAALCSLAFFSLFPSVSADEHASGPVVLELKLDGEVEPVLATYIDEGIDDATKRQASLVLITMDTPGGLSSSMTSSSTFSARRFPSPSMFLRRARAPLPPASSFFFPRISPLWRRLRTRAQPPR